MATESRTDGVKVVSFDEVPVGHLLELLATCLGPGAVARDEAFWRWKHEDNPFGRSVGLSAVADGRPVALRVFLRWRLAVQGRTIETVRAVDTATHPEWRRRGLFRRLTLELAERVQQDGAAFVFNTPNPKSRAGYLSMDWEDVGRVPVLVRLRRPVRALRALVRAPERGPEHLVWTLEGLRPVGELLEEPGLAGLLAMRSEPRLHTPRTLEYLRWRYREAPGVGYGALWRFDGSSGAALVVRSRLRRGLRELTVSELLLSDDAAGRRAARELLREVADVPGVDHIVAVAMPETAERQALRSAGWLPVPFGPRLTVRPLRAGAPDPRRMAAWRLSAGDLELF